MSHHISHIDPKQGCDCGCRPHDLEPSRLDQLIKQYEELLEQTEAVRQDLLQRIEDLSSISTGVDHIDTSVLALETTTAKQQTLLEIKQNISTLDAKVSPYLYPECTIEEINDMFN